MAAFAAYTDLEDRLRTTFSAGEQLDATALLDHATALIKAEARQTIEAVTADSVTLDGNGQTILPLPQIPVTAVTSVTFDGTLQTVTTDYLVDLPQGLLYRAYSGSWWLAGKTWGVKPRSVVVIYNHGYATIPADLKAVCVELAARAWATPVGAVQQESIGSFSRTYVTGGGSSTGLALTDDERVVVRQYRRIPVA